MIIGLVLAQIFKVSVLWFAVNLQCDGYQATGIWKLLTNRLEGRTHIHV